MHCELIIFQHPTLEKFVLSSSESILILLCYFIPFSNCFAVNYWGCLDVNNFFAKNRVRGYSTNDEEKGDNKMISILIENPLSLVLFPHPSSSPFPSLLDFLLILRLVPVKDFVLFRHTKRIFLVKF